MKPPMQEELEDDLAAEEENKLINEVCCSRPEHLAGRKSHEVSVSRSTRHGKRARAGVQ